VTRALHTRRVRSCCSLAALVALALVPLGCGQESEVRQTVEHVVQGLAERDGRRACEPLTEQAELTIARLSATPLRCRQVVESLPARTFEGCRDVEVTDVRVRGDEAQVTIDRPGRDFTVFLTRKLAPEWKVRTPPCGPETKP
jgi:hypothetical protein